MGKKDSDNSIYSQLLDRLATIRRRREDVLPKTWGEKQIIYFAPPRYSEAKKEAFMPYDVSIGPFHSPKVYHQCNESIQVTENIKQRFYWEFLDRTKVPEDSLAHKLAEMEGNIQCWYGPYDKYSRAEFLEIMLIDSCFIIELFLKVHLRVEGRGKSLEFISDRKESDIFIDLLLMQNQIPFRVIEELYNLAGLDRRYKSIRELTFWYFKKMNPQEKAHTIEPYPVHFTDMLRNFMLPTSDIRSWDRKEELIHEVYNISRLWDVGIKFVASTSKCILEIEFDKDQGVLIIPIMEVYDTTDIRLRNVIGFEQHYYPKLPLIAEHMYILSLLIKTGDDVQKLRDAQIIVNKMGENHEVAKMFDVVSHGLVIQDMYSEYGVMCRNINAYYDASWRRHWATLKHQFFNTPWNTMSIICQVLTAFFNSVEAACGLFKNQLK